MVWHLTPCCLVEVFQLFGRIRCYHRTAKMEKPPYSETSEGMCQATRRHIRYDSVPDSLGKGMWAGLRWLRMWSGGGLSW